MYDREDGLAAIRETLQFSKQHIVGHNLPFDFGVLAAEDPSLLPLIFAAYEDGRVRDTMLRQKLLDVADGVMKFHWVKKPDGTAARAKTTYHLDALVARRLGRVLQKEGTFRLRYHELDGVPIERWPEEAKKYATDDAAATLEVFLDQEKELDGDELPNEREQSKASWALHLMSAWGVRTDPAAVEELLPRLELQVRQAQEKLTKTGIYRPNGTKDMDVIRDRIAKSWPFDKRGPLPTTPTGQVQTGSEVLEACEDPDLRVLAEALEAADRLSDWGGVLRAGAARPICARYNPLVETGRTSCGGPNMQNPPRKGGIRECFVPRPGYVFAACDYDTLELRSLAQVCLDFLQRSEMAQALRRGEDLHLNLAAQMLSISKEEAAARLAAGDPEVEEYRQQAKPANFGFPGGMAPRSYVAYAAGYGIKLSEEKAEEIYRAWKSAWPEMNHYFRYVQDMLGSFGDGRVIQDRSGRIRGGVSFCAAANGFFQGLAADGAKEALWRVARESYVEPASALYGSRPVIFMHDEIIAEVPEARAAEAAERLGIVMVEAMQKFIPDVPISAKPVLMRRWYKGAKALKVDGRLVPSKPEKVDGKTVWVADL